MIKTLIRICCCCCSCGAHSTPKMGDTSANKLTSTGASLVAGKEHSQCLCSGPRQQGVLPESKACWAVPLQGVTTMCPGHLEDVSQKTTSSREAFLLQRVHTPTFGEAK